MFRPGNAEIVQSQLTNFIAYCAIHTGRTFEDYTSFEQFSRDNYQSFWRLFMAWTALPRGEARLVLQRAEGGNEVSQASHTGT